MPVEFPKSNSQIRESQRRQREAMEAEEDICRKCFQTDHRRGVCDQIGIVACTECYKANVFATYCCLRNGREEIAGQHQVLRFAGYPIPRIFMDINVLTVNIPALIDTGSERSRIDVYLAGMLHRMQKFGDPGCLTTPTGMSVPIGIRGKITYLDCSVEILQPTIHLILGMDFLMTRPFEIKFDNIWLNSRYNWQMKHHEEVNYVYNMRRGQELRRLLHKQGHEFKRASRKKAFNRHRQFFSNNHQLHNRYY